MENSNDNILYSNWFAKAVFLIKKKLIKFLQFFKISKIEIYFFKMINYILIL